MNHFAIATKVWNDARATGNKLILKNCSKDDIAILAHDNNWKSVKAATAGLNATIIRHLEFKATQAAKNQGAKII